MKKTGLMVFLLLAVGTANAAKFGVRVVSESGEPIAGAAVCIGTHGNYRQFAAQFTSITGNVTVEVPNVPLVVTVSRNRFSGIRMAEPARSFNLVKEVRLLDDVPGPRCRAGSTLVNNGSNGGDDSYLLGVDDIFVQTESSGIGGTDSAMTEVAKMSLIPSVTGYPSHYRLSASTSFDESQWLEFSPAIALPARLHDKKSIYMQLRRRLDKNNGWIEARSDIVSFELPKL